ncbi:MAG: hypothetical protein JWQ78_1858 [Sediminibacterium sp.]|nr:hypothetical protein [Sediminibacterium sp.]
MIITKVQAFFNTESQRSTQRDATLQGLRLVGSNINRKVVSLVK